MGLYYQINYNKNGGGGGVVITQQLSSWIITLFLEHPEIFWTCKLFPPIKNCTIVENVDFRYRYRCQQLKSGTVQAAAVLACQSVSPTAPVLWRGIVPAGESADPGPGILPAPGPSPLPPAALNTADVQQTIRRKRDQRKGGQQTTMKKIGNYW